MGANTRSGSYQQIMETYIEPGLQCELMKDTLMGFFQGLDSEMSTLEMVEAFQAWMNQRGLTIFGKLVTIQVAKDAQITQEQISRFEESLKNNAEMWGIVHSDELTVTTHPACEHLQKV